MKRISLKTANEYTKPIGIKVTRATKYDDYKVSFINADRDYVKRTAYYTDDIYDAVQTAQVMHRQEKLALEVIGEVYLSATCKVCNH